MRPPRQERIQGRAKGAMALPHGQVCPIKSHRSAPARAHFTEKVTQLGHILLRECHSWGTFCRKSAKDGTDGKVPEKGQILRKMCPMSRNLYALFAPRFLSSKFCICP